MIGRKILTHLKRELYSDKVVVLTGMRRVGKTTLIRHLYDGIKNKRKLYLDLENPLNQSYFSEVDYDKIKVYLERLAEGKGKDLIIFLDEIQNVKNLPSVVKYLYDHYLIKFVLIGSASFYLKNLFSESLAGRKRIFELFPLDFGEFLKFKATQLKKPNLKEKLNKNLFELYAKYELEYLTYGGFPSVVLKDSHQEKMAELEDIFTSYFQKEIQVLSDFRKLEVMKSTISLLLERVGSKIDLSKIASELGVSRITIREYLDFLEGTYFLKRIRAFSRKPDISLRKQAKLYICDSGFLNKMGKIPEASIFENTVCNLLSHLGEVSFYQSKGGMEIDFIVKKDGQYWAFEVKTYPHPADLGRLKKNCQKLGISHYRLVSQKFSSLPKVVYLSQL